MENKIQKGFYTTEYFKKTKKILINNQMHNETTMQFYCLKCNDYMLSGIEEIKRIILNNFTKEDLEKLIIYFRNDGEIINKNEPVISITGDYSLLCEYENIFNSILCRNSSVASNGYELSKVVNIKKIINMNERSDHYSLQEIDGYSSWLSGIKLFTTDAQINLINDKSVKVIGTLPHAIFQQFRNNVNKLIEKYNELFSDLILLIDFENDVIKTLESIKKYFPPLKGVRIDTSINLIDKSIEKLNIDDDQKYGVNIHLINLVRNFLNENNGKHIQIVVSSGLNLEKIKELEELKAPVDFYGVGAYFNKSSTHFTCDLVKIENENFAKFGRKYLDTKKMYLWNFKNEK